jgi:hypothetical protein
MKRLLLRAGGGLLAGAMIVLPISAFGQGTQTGTSTGSGMAVAPTASGSPAEQGQPAVTAPHESKRESKAGTEANTKAMDAKTAKAGDTGAADVRAEGRTAARDTKAAPVSAAAEAPKPAPSKDVTAAEHDTVKRTGKDVAHRKPVHHHAAAVPSHASGHPAS